MILENIHFILLSVFLGGFIGLDRFFSGARFAVSVHACAGFAGCLVGLVFLGDEDELGETFALAAASIAVVGLALAFSRIRQALALAGDWISASTAFAVGATCGSLEWRAVVLAVIAAVVVTVFRPRGVAAADSLGYRTDLAKSKAAPSSAKAKDDRAPAAPTVAAAPMAGASRLAAPRADTRGAPPGPLLSFAAERSRRLEWQRDGEPKSASPYGAGPR
jgi:hypothetical protein